MAGKRHLLSAKGAAWEKQQANNYKNTFQGIQGVTYSKVGESGGD
jgi:hypothetical protein